jgi:glycosyltransferase involved in cell wall biosynthesis
VIVPVRNGGATLGACLDGLRAQLEPALRVEVIVVDNGSTDGTAALARRHPIAATVVTERRPGSYAARNAGGAAAAGDVLAFTDADCVPEAGWLRAGLAALRDADLVGGRVVPVLRRQPTVWERFDAGHHVDQRKYVEELGFAATANLLVRRCVYESVGGFDAVMTSGGDRAFCVRATAAGFRLAYAPGAAVRHGTRRTAAATWRLHRRLGAGLRQLHRRGMQPPWWRDDQMLLPLGWAAEVASGPDRRYRHREMLPLAALIVAARAAGRVVGR